MLPVLFDIPQQGRISLGLLVGIAIILVFSTLMAE